MKLVRALLVTLVALAPYAVPAGPCATNARAPVPTPSLPPLRGHRHPTSPSSTARS